MSDKVPTPIQRAELAEAEVTRLTGELTQANQTIATITGERNKANGDVAKLTGDLAAERAEHGKTKVALTTAQSELGTVKTEKETLEKDFDAKVTKLASAKAAEIVAAQHVPGLKAAVNNDQTKTDPPAGGKKKTALESLAAGAKADLARINAR